MRNFLIWEKGQFKSKATKKNQQLDNVKFGKKMKFIYWAKLEIWIWCGYLLIF